MTDWTADNSYFLEYKARIDAGEIVAGQELYLELCNLAEDFKWSVEERRGEILEFLEKLMDLGELADATATKIIFKGQLGAMMGIPQEQDAEPEVPSPAVEAGASMELPQR